MAHHIIYKQFRIFFSVFFVVAVSPVLVLPAFSAINIITTTTDMASIAKFVGGDFVTVKSLSKGAQDPHFIDAKPSIMKTLSNADLFVVVGLEMEIGYLSPLLDGARNSNFLVGASGYIDASVGIKVLEKPTGVVDRSKGDVHLLGNPHYWLDPLNGEIIAKNIAGALIKINPDNAEIYQGNVKTFSNKLKTKMDFWTKTLKPFKGQKIITYHNSWLYFANRFGLTILDYIETKPGIPPTPNHLFQLIKKMKSENVKLILVEPYFSLKPAESVAAKTGAKVLVVAPSVAGEPGVTDYFELFDHLTKEIAKVLK